MSKLKVFEAFAGIGAQNKALKILKNKMKIDFEVVGTSEWDIWANISYNAMHNNNENRAINLKDSEINKYLSKFTHSNDGKKPIDKKFLNRLDRNTRELLYSSYEACNNQGSIVDLKGEDLIKNVGDVDVITYSFPCQDLSVAGSFHGFNQGMKKGSGTRSGLLWEIERILKELKKINKLPKYLLLENVKNMISEKHKEDYIEWLIFLKTIGYNTQTYLLNSLEFGIPQKRERVYAISVLGNDNLFPDTLNQKNIIIENEKFQNVSKELNLIKSLNEILKTNYTNNIYKDEAINAIPNNTPSRIRMYCENPILYTKKNYEYPLTIKKNNKLYVKKNDGYYLQLCRTITTKQDRHPNAGIIDIRESKLLKEKHKSNYRFLTPRETYLLMGFDEKDFNKVIKNNIKKAVLYRQAGNSITVNVLVSIFKKINDIDNEVKNND